MDKPRKIKVELTLTVPPTVSNTSAIKAFNAMLDVGYADAVATEGTDFENPNVATAASLKISKPRLVK